MRGVRRERRLEAAASGRLGICRAQGVEMEYPLIRGGADLSRGCAQETECWRQAQQRLRRASNGRGRAGADQ